MLHAFLIDGDGHARFISESAELPSLAGSDVGHFWIDLHAPPEDLLAEIGKQLELDRAAIEDCLQGEQRPRVDDYDAYLMFVLYSVASVHNDMAHEPKKMTAFLGRNFLLTVHQEPIRTISEELKRLDRNSRKLAGTTPDEFLYRLIDGMVDKFALVMNRLMDDLDELEEFSMRSDATEQVLADANGLRRRWLNLRRLAVSQRELVYPLARGQFDHLNESLAMRFRHVQDHLTHTIELTDTFRDRLRSIHDNFHATLATRINKTMRTLTVVATSMLPMSLIAGIYGMNVQVWPASETQNAFWWILLAMAIIGAATTFVFARRS
ncbi:MAG: magnesium transporter CorA family protein [Phycisphaerae bacterium]